MANPNSGQPLLSWGGWVVAIVLACVFIFQQCGSNDVYQSPADLNPSKIVRQCSFHGWNCSYVLTPIPDKGNLPYSNEEDAHQTGRYIDQLVKSQQSVSPVTAATVAACPASKVSTKTKIVSDEAEEGRLKREIKRLTRELGKKPLVPPTLAPICGTKETVKLVETSCVGSVTATFQVPEGSEGYLVVAMQQRRGDKSVTTSFPEKVRWPGGGMRCLYLEKGVVLSNLQVKNLKTGNVFWVLDVKRPHLINGKVAGYELAIPVQIVIQGQLGRSLGPEDTMMSASDHMPMFIVR